MTASGKKHDTGCLIARGVDVFGDRWTLLVLRDMVLFGKRRYGEFLESEEKIATNILADRLKCLEEQGIVSRTRDPDNRRSYIYALTDKGLGLVPVLFEIIRWSGRYEEKLTPSREKLIKRIEEDRDGFLAEIRDREAAYQAAAS